MDAVVAEGRRAGEYMYGVFLIKGLAMGFAVAAPVGPIGVLCIRRTFAEGSGYGLASGLGAATADAVYGSVAAFGLAFVARFLQIQQEALHLVGGAFLCYLGLRTFLVAPAQRSATGGRGLLGSWAATFFLTLTNPMTILSFAAIFAGLGLVGTEGDLTSAAELVAGVFLGSALWWLILVGGVGAFRTRFSPERMRWVNKASGVLIAGFGLAALLSAVG